MSEFFEKTFYGNTVWEWTVSLLIIAGAFIGAKMLILGFREHCKTDN
jgi:hypothetical protein